MIYNAPQSIIESQIFREIDFTKATKYKSYHIPFRANPNYALLRLSAYCDR